MAKEFRYSIKTEFRYLEDIDGKPILTRKHKGKNVIICVYPEEWKLPLEPDDAYSIALSGKYFFKVNYDDNPNYLGGPDGLLQQLSYHTGYTYSWPDTYKYYFRFNRWDLFQVEPVRELLRRHFDQEAKIYDIDLCIK